MRHILFFAIGLLAAMSFSSCGEDAFTQIVDIELPEHEPRLAVHALVFSETDAFGVLVSNSRSVLSKEEFSVFPDAEIQFSGPNVDGAAFSYTPDDGRHYTVLGEDWALAGAEYSLGVRQEAYPEVSVRQRMPKAPIISDVTVEEDGALSDGSGRVDEITIEIEDEPGTHYYALQAEVEQMNFDPVSNDTLIGSYSLWLNSNDPILSYAEVDRRPALICSDGAFEGATYRFVTYTWENLPVGQENSTLRVRVTSLSRDTYLYYRSLDQYREADGNPFAEPVTVHSNIENGYGIFGLGHTTIYEIDL